MPMRTQFWLSAVVSVCSLSFAECEEGEKRFSMDDYYAVDKIDAHFHLRTRNTDFVTLAQRDKFRYVNIAVHSNSPIEMDFRLRTTFIQLRAHPNHIAAASAFPMAGWDEPDWQKKTIAHLDATFEKGAVAVKVWKNIGMDFKDKNGNLIMIDDPKFDPIFAHLANKGIRLIGHLGEPRNCWLPLEKMTVKNDRNYFERNPEYHMFKHPGMPTYEQQMAARDRMLAKNPNLHFIGAHFGSLEWSVDELAKFLDRFPNATVDTAARMGQLQYQSIRDREKVVKFLRKYQDRILYGTDFTMQPDSIPPDDPRAGPKTVAGGTGAISTRTMKWQSRNSTIPSAESRYPGESLKRSTGKNAERVFPGAWSAGNGTSSEQGRSGNVSNR